MIDNIKNIFKRCDCELFDYEFDYSPMGFIGDLPQNDIRVYLKFRYKNVQIFEINKNVQDMRKFIEELKSCVEELTKCLT